MHAIALAIFFFFFFFFFVYFIALDLKSQRSALGSEKRIRRIK